MINRVCVVCFEGGTFALYSLLCRYAKLSILPNHQEMDEKLSTYATGSPGETRQSAAVKSFFEKHPKSQKCLLLFVLLGTCMAIGDSVLTPTISGEYPENFSAMNLRQINIILKHFGILQFCQLFLESSSRFPTFTRVCLNLLAYFNNIY